MCGFDLILKHGPNMDQTHYWAPFFGVSMRAAVSCLALEERITGKMNPSLPEVTFIPRIRNEGRFEALFLISLATLVNHFGQIPECFGGRHSNSFRRTSSRG
jgi:hypothetical protein